MAAEEDRTRSVELSFSEGQRFEVMAASGSIVLDGDRASGLSPMEGLLASVGGCMGIDVVSILKKMRVPIAGLELTVAGDRKPDPPERFESLRLSFRIRGAVPRDKAERAVALSRDRYCSVLHTLRPDLAISTEIQLD